MRYVHLFRFAEPGLHFRNRADRTKADYRKVTGYLDPVLNTPAHLLDTPLISAIHKKRRWARSDGGRRISC